MPTPQVASSAAPDAKAEPCQPEALCGARDAFGQAKKAGAEVKAPYEYYSAEEYLKLAEKERIEADLKAAEEYSATARKYADEAIIKAGGGAK